MLSHATSVGRKSAHEKSARVGRSTDVADVADAMGPDPKVLAEILPPTSCSVHATRSPGSVPATWITNSTPGPTMPTTRSRRRTSSRMNSRGEIPMRPFGRYDELVSALALGGYHLGLAGNQREAVRIVHAAIDAGITFMDNAWEYHDGESEEILGKALVDRRDEVFLMTKVCTHGRDRAVAMRQLQQSLRRLKTDHLDLWQVHECVYPNDPERHFASGGVIEALVEAKEQGLVRYVGFTGHKSPDIHLAMLAYDFPFDSVQMPLNCFDASFKSFEREVLPIVN